MEAKRAFPRRIGTIFLVLLALIVIWNAAFAIATGQTIAGVLGGVVGLILLIAVQNGRLVGYLDGRPVPFIVFPFLILIVFILGIGEVQDLLINDLFLLGDFYLPGLIALIRIIGSFVLLALLVWEVVNLARQEPVA